MNRNDVNKLGNIFGFTGGSYAGIVYHPCGLAPTVNTAQGGFRMPLVLEMDDKHDRDYRNKTEDSTGN